MTEFFAQGGYAFYVWGSYGLAAILIIAEIVQLSRRHETILARLGRLVRLRSNRHGDTRHLRQ